MTLHASCYHCEHLAIRVSTAVSRTAICVLMGCDTRGLVIIQIAEDYEQLLEGVQLGTASLDASHTAIDSSW